METEDREKLRQALAMCAEEKSGTLFGGIGGGYQLGELSRGKRCADGVKNDFVVCHGENLQKIEKHCCVLLIAFE